MRTKYAKHDKPLTIDEQKPLERPLGFASRPIRDGKIERTSKGRKFVPKRAKLEDCRVTYTDSGERTVHQPRQRMRKVKWGKKWYSVPSNIVGSPTD